MSKVQKIKDLIADTGWSDKQIAKRVKCSIAYVNMVRNGKTDMKADDAVVRPRVVGPHKVMRVNAKQQEQIKELLHTVTQGRQAREANTSIDAILDERQGSYGLFAGQAEVSQAFKNIMMAHLIKLDKRLVVDQQEALEMIFSKVARILNGDSNHLDSWKDISGYAQLVADRLEGKSR